MNEEFYPLVSIIIPVYNGSNYLAEAIDSALEQTYKNIEVLVINDGSTDDGKTERIARSYGNKIKYYKKKNGGVATALNLGIEKMSGEYFSWLSHDDIYYKDKIKNSINRLRQSEDKNKSVLCSINFIDQYGNEFCKGQFPNSKVENGLKLLVNGYINGCALMLPKKILDNNKFNKNLPTTQDYDLWYRIFKNTNVLLTQYCGVGSRSHPEQGSKELINIHIKECENLWKKIILETDESVIKQSYKNRLSFLLETQNYIESNTLYNNTKLLLEHEVNKELKANETDKKIIDKLCNSCHIKNKIKLENLLNKKSLKKRICFGCFGSWKDKGGLNRVVANICNNLSDDYNILILAENGPEGGYDIDEKIDFLTLLVNDIPAQNLNKELYKLLFLLGCDLYVNLYNCELRFINLCEYLKERNMNVFAWNHEHYFLPYYNNTYINVIEKRNKTFEKIDCVIWLTEYSKYASRYFMNNSIKIENAIPIQSKLNYKKNCVKKELVSIARFDDQRKNLKGLLYFLSELIKVDNSFRLNVVGNVNFNLRDEDGKTISELIKELNLTEKNLIFKGQVENINEIYEKVDFNIVTSYHEGFGLTIIEAAAYGVPTLGYNDNGYEDMIKDNVNGYLVDRDDYKKMVELIVNIFKNNKKYREMSENCIGCSKKYLNDEIVCKWKTLLKNFFEMDKNKFQNFIKTFNCSEINEKMAEKNIVKEYEKCMIKSIKHQSISNHEIEYLINVINNYENSKSMKITKPLRKIRQLLIRK